MCMWIGNDITNVVHVVADLISAGKSTLHQVGVALLGRGEVVDVQDRNVRETAFVRHISIHAVWIWGIETSCTLGARSARGRLCL
jgi:hypothetical protein